MFIILERKLFERKTKKVIQHDMREKEKKTSCKAELNVKKNA